MVNKVFLILCVFMKQKFCLIYFPIFVVKLDIHNTGFEITHIRQLIYDNPPLYVQISSDEYI